MLLLLLVVLLVLLLLLYNYYKLFIVFLYKVLWATHSIRVIQGLYHVIYFVSVDHTCHTYGQACPRALIWAFSLLAIADYRTLDTAQTVYDCVHTHIWKKKMCKANVWSTLGVLVTVQSDCRGWKAKPWSRCQKSSWNNLDARSLTLKNSFIAMHRSNFREKTHPSSRWMNPNHILYTFVQRLFATQKIWHEHIAPPAELSWC